MRSHCLIGSLLFVSAFAFGCSGAGADGAESEGSDIREVPAGLVGEWRGTVVSTNLQFSAVLGGDGKIAYEDNRAGGGARCTGSLAEASQEKVAASGLKCKSKDGKSLSDLTLSIAVPGGWDRARVVKAQIESSQLNGKTEALFQQLPNVTFGNAESFSKDSKYKLIFSVGGRPSNIDLTFGGKSGSVTAEGVAHTASGDFDFTQTVTKNGNDYDAPTEGKFVHSGSSLRLDFTVGGKALNITLDLSKVKDINSILYAERVNDSSREPIATTVAGAKADNGFLGNKDSGYPIAR